MSSISINSGKSTISSEGQSPAELVIKRSIYLCPKCNRKYDAQFHNGSYFGRVPLILSCTHNICEDCVRTALNLSQTLTCSQCHENSPVPDKTKIQQYFQVNFHLLGDLQYSKTCNVEPFSLHMRPTGMRYKDRASSSLEEKQDNYVSYIKSFATQAAAPEKCSQLHCKKPATLSCIECNEVFCEPCSNNLHRSARGLQKHQILSVTSPVVPELSNKCPDHVEQALEFNCSTCEKLLCCYCVLQKHSGHNFVMLSNLSEEDRPSFDQLILNVEEKVKKFILAHKKIEAELTNLRRVNFNKENSTELEISRCFANLHAKLQCLENKILHKATEVKNKNITALQHLKDEIASNIQTSLPLLKSAKNINNSNVKLNIQVLSQRLNNILSNPCYLLGEMDNANIGFQFDDTCLDFEECFLVTHDAKLETYRLVGDDELPAGYDTALPATMAELSLENFAAEKRTTSSTSSGSDTFSTAHTSAHINKANNTANEPKFQRRLSNVKYSGVSKLKKDERESVSVMHINSPESFYVQLTRLANIFEKFSRDINQFAKTTAYVEKPEVNQMYFVKYVSSKRPEWSRGRVIEIKKNELDEDVYDVMFIDYGTSKTVTSKMIKEIPLEFSKPRPFAVHCKLHNTFPVKEWDERSMKLMAQIVNNSCIILVISNGNGISEVELYVTSGGDNMASVRDALIFIGHAVPSLDVESSLTNVRVKPVLPLRKLTTNIDAFRKEKSLEVIISFITNPDEIYVQQVPLLHHISQLNESMTKYYMDRGVSPGQNNSNIYAPSKDMAVALQTTDFNTSQWYRGIVTDVSNGQGLVEVFLVDYGKTISAVYTQLRQLPERFRQTSCQAIKVKMADIKPCGGGQWSTSAIHYLQNLSDNKERLRLTVAEANYKQTIQVILFETHALVDVCLNSLMVKEGFAESTGELSTQVEWYKENKEVPQHKIKSVFSLIRTSKDSDESEGESDGDDSTVPKKFVQILLVKNPGLIYVTFEDASVLAAQTKLFRDLQLFYGTRHKAANPEATVGTICVVFHKEKQEYYRAIVTDELDDNCFKVLLRDVAEELIVPIRDVYVMESQFRQICEGSIRCHLADIVPAGDSPKWSSTSIDFLNEIFSKGEILLAKNGLVDKERKSLPVIMWYTEFKPGGALEPSRTILHNVNNLLVKRGVALKSTVVSSGSSLLDALSKPTASVNSEVSPSMQDEQPEKSQEIDTAADHDDTNKFYIGSSSNKTANADMAVKQERERGSPKVSKLTSVLTLDWLPAKPFTRTQFDAIATYVDNYANIYIHDVSLAEDLKKMEANMKATFDALPPEPEDTIWQPGQLCTVRYSLTNCWYRGKIVSVTGSIINVFLIDYGNVEECGHEDLRLKIIHTELPAMAKKVHLHKVVCKSVKWWTSDLDELHATVVDKRISVTLKGDVRLNTSLPAKILIGGVHVNKELVLLSKNLQYGYNKVIDEEEDADDVVVEGEIYENDFGDVNFDDRECYNQVVLDENCKGKKLRVSIISVCSFNTFIFEVINDVTLFEQKDLFHKISIDVKLLGHKQPPLQNIEIGYACIAIFSEDKEFYRAQIEAQPLNGLVLVWFVDFGNFEFVPVESVRKIHQNWLRLPILQYRGELFDIKCAYSEGPKYIALIEQLSELCNTQQDAEIVEVDPLLVRLYTPDGELSYKSLIEDGSLLLD